MVAQNLLRQRGESGKVQVRVVAGVPCRVDPEDAHYRGDDECIYGVLYRARLVG